MFDKHVPVIDGSVKGWTAELDALAQIPARQVVPGHGPAGAAWPEALAPERRSFETLSRDLKAEIGKGFDVRRAAEAAAGAERDDWRLFDVYIPRNATAAYAEFEWDP